MKTTATITKNPTRRAGSKRRKQSHTSLKVILTAGAFLSTWLGTGWLAQQDSANATVASVVEQPVTVTYVNPTTGITEQSLALQPIPQVVVSSRSSQ